MKTLRKFGLFFLMSMLLWACGDTNEETQQSTGQVSDASHAMDTSQPTDAKSQETTEGSVQEVAYECISQDEAKELMFSEEGYIILDVRTQVEFDEGHILGAICVPNESIGDAMPVELPELEQLILVYCRSGNRSKQASQKLAEIGYTNVKEFGGINTWDGEIE